MRTFNVFQHPDAGLVAVKVGFSWPAFFFGFIWMMFKKMWGLVGAWLGMYFVLTLIEKFLEGVVKSNAHFSVQVVLWIFVSGAYVTLWLLPAFRGNQWVERNLRAQGYVAIFTVEAENALEASYSCNKADGG
jgi:hypothetical protein